MSVNIIPFFPPKKYIFDYYKNRKINHDEVFDQTSSEVDGIRGIFMRLKNVLIAELHATWDIVFLERYLKEQMIPRSLIQRGYRTWGVVPLL